MIEWTIKSLYISFKSFGEVLCLYQNHKILLKLYHSLVLHPCFSITVSKFYQKSSIKASNRSLLVDN